MKSLYARILFTIVLGAWFPASNISAKGAESRPLRMEVKFGLPNFLGLNAEYIWPGFNNRFGINLGISSLPIGNVQLREGNDTIQSEGGYKYFGIGLNAYLLKAAEGPMVQFAYDIPAAWGYDRDETSETLTQTIHLASFKAGYRFVWSAFSILIDLGYGFNFNYSPIEKPALFNETYVIFGNNNWFLFGISAGFAL